VAQAKRSPILGYNHNIKYRGVVFHVQTEDSGLLNPHLFTHLFHEGVIVSTRKLVYDAGSNEEAIKALMQAQHKAVMKDLKKGVFDEKIDQYLGGTPGLEPRQNEDPAVAAARPRGDRAKTEASPPPEEVIASLNAGLETASGTALEVINEELSEPIELPVKQRTKSDDRTRPIELPVAAQPAAQDMPVKSRTSTAQRGSSSAVGKTTPARGSRTVGASAPHVDISEEEIANRLRSPRDTAVESLEDIADGIPSRPGDSVPPATVPVRNDRAAAHNAASLPPSKPPSRPISPVVPRTESDDRAGTYSVSRKSGDAPIREKTGRIAAINSQQQQPPVARPGVPSRQPTGERTGSGPNRVPPNIPREPTPGTAIPRTGTPPNPAPNRGAPQQVRPSVTAPIANRSSTPVSPQPNSGVVMTRPAVVVGAPPKPAQQPPRVRKAREDEGRGFGQGLISEKSLDEVILAYLSEDADDK
jgi:hypothetical protein